MAGIDEVQNNQTLMGSSEVWITLAFISELSGEFDKAYEYAVKAKAHVELSYLPDEIKAVILNDCARYEIIHDSRAEADKSMQAAWNYIKRQKSVLRERIAINLIQIMLEYGYSESLVMRAFEELNNIHDIGNISADIDFFNIQVSILRQFGRKQECYELIKLFYRDIAQKLNKSQIECIKATVFHQMMDGEYDYTWIDRDIVTNPAYYADLNIYDRTFIFRHYYEVLSQAIYRYVRLRKPYADLYEIIMSYYNGTSEYLGSAIDDIDYDPGISKFKWDTKRKGQGIKVYNNGESIFLNETCYAFRSIVASEPFMEGIHYFEIIADKRTESELKIGFTKNPDFNYDTSFSDYPFGWAFYGVGQLRHDNNAGGENYGKKFKKYGTLGVFLDMNKGIMSFSLDKEYFGIAYQSEDLKTGPIYPAVSLLHVGGCTLQCGIPAKPYFFGDN